MSKKLTFAQYKILINRRNIAGGLTSVSDDYQALLPYLADEQEESIQAFNERIRQHLDSVVVNKPEPSRLEVAMMYIDIKTSLELALAQLEELNELIKQSKA